MSELEVEEAVPETLWHPGDLVWVRVQGYPSWPGQVMDPKYASKKVKKGEQPNMTLVSFFGDASYGWFYNDVILDFGAFYEQNSKQVATSRSKKAFKAAVEEGKEVFDRRNGEEPVTNHQPLDFLEPGAFSEEEKVDEESEEPVAFVPRVSEVKNCPKGVMMEWARALAQDPLGVMELEDATLDAALNEMWSYSCSIRTGGDDDEEGGGKDGRGKKRRGKAKKRQDVDDEEYVPDDKEGAENQPEAGGNRMAVDSDGSGDAGGGDVDVYNFDPEDDEPPPSKPRRRRSVRQSASRTAKKKVAENIPPEKVGRKYKARKKKRARRKVDDRVKFELPEHFDDIEITCTPEEVRNWALELGRDPLGRGLEKKEDGVADPDQGGVMRWEVPEIALIRCRQKLFKTRGGGPRKSSLAETGENASAVTPKKPRQSRKRASDVPSEKKITKARKSNVKKEGTAKRNSTAGGKRKSSLVGAGEGGASTKKPRLKNYSGEPQRAERAVVHVQFPQDVDFPSIPQVHLFLNKRYPGLPMERLFPKTKEHKMTVIFPSAEVAKEGVDYFVERGPQFFHMAEGSIFTATSGYVPGGTKNNSREGSDNKPERRNTGGGGGLPAANYIIPTAVMGTQTNMDPQDHPSNPNTISAPVAHYLPTGGASHYSNPQIQTIPMAQNVSPMSWVVTNPSVGPTPPQVVPGGDMMQVQPPPAPPQMGGAAHSLPFPVMADNPVFMTDPRVKVDGKDVEQGSDLFNVLNAWEKGPDPGEGPSQW
ncbi:hypothetical protein BSKO_12782 [Bryopsis sp. KO-2023]|nr:hypothetical protein BSKO_12782 [Bryopsis sp. KO-2023]